MSPSTTSTCFSTLPRMVIPSLPWAGCLRTSLRITGLSGTAMLNLSSGPPFPLRNLEGVGLKNENLGQVRETWSNAKLGAGILLAPMASPGCCKQENQLCPRRRLKRTLKQGQGWEEQGGKLTGNCLSWEYVWGILAASSQGCTCPASPSSCRSRAREGRQHSWHSAALTPHALFTRIRMQIGLAAGLVVCRELSETRDSGNGLLLRALPIDPHPQGSQSLADRKKYKAHLWIQELGRRERIPKSSRQSRRSQLLLPRFPRSRVLW